MTVEEAEERMSSMEVTEWWAVLKLEAEELEAARTGQKPRPALPSQDDLRRKVERIFGVAA